LKFETETRQRTTPLLRIIHSTHPNSSSHCYPEGYFRGNQLLSVSMSLSPLGPAPTSDLHVSTVRGLPPEFPLASTTPSQDRRFSGLKLLALDVAVPEDNQSGLRFGVLAPKITQVALTAPFTLFGKELANNLNSLARVSRRDDHGFKHAVNGFFDTKQRTTNQPFSLKPR
jgi:hypothetical protein